MPVSPIHHPAIDSWPPTQVHLSPRILDEAALISDQPFSYFLMPGATYDSDDDFSDLDAGIEGTGFSSARGKSGASNLSFECSIKTGRPSLALTAVASDDSSDEEDYIRLPPGGFGQLYQLADPCVAVEDGKSGRHAKERSKKKAFQKVARVARGRSATRQDDDQDPSRLSVMMGKRSRRAWREPSPYVWSIDEETEGSRELHQKEAHDLGDSKHVVVTEQQLVNRASAAPRPRSALAGVRQLEFDDAKVAAKLKERKVRFVLPQEASR
ncbi:unnamed protein product [Parascedosporium putredinis]|uniref:Uncharacterized protein n=1 Tax=Parascedosporium putredinis TaxID=1442378 RepID=A0A9P1GY54_9PEZI|nr:unnamed protein product [Parascedosporium putredinis]CAI7991337.1 unnamed protein product [Parascedosporium putredinis]